MSAIALLTTVDLKASSSTGKVWIVFSMCDNSEMGWRLSDVSRAGLVGACLLASAAFAVFGFQHGFEEQVGWYVSLLPGAIIAAAISDMIRKAIPGADRVAFWTLLIGLNFIWYFGISWVVIKVYRFISGASKSP